MEKTNESAVVAAPWYARRPSVLAVVGEGRGMRELPILAPGEALIVEPFLRQRGDRLLDRLPGLSSQASPDTDRRVRSRFENRADGLRIVVPAGIAGGGRDVLCREMGRTIDLLLPEMFGAPSGRWQEELDPDRVDRFLFRRAAFLDALAGEVEGSRFLLHPASAVAKLEKRRVAEAMRDVPGWINDAAGAFGATVLVGDRFLADRTATEGKAVFAPGYSGGRSHDGGVVWIASAHAGNASTLQEELLHAIDGRLGRGPAHAFTDADAWRRADIAEQSGHECVPSFAPGSLGPSTRGEEVRRLLNEANEDGKSNLFFRCSGDERRAELLVDLFQAAGWLRAGGHAPAETDRIMTQLFPQSWPLATSPHTGEEFFRAHPECEGLRPICPDVVPFVEQVRRLYRETTGRELDTGAEPAVAMRPSARIRA